MNSWLLDASMELVHSHDEDTIRIYTVVLKFKDLFGNERKHFATAELPQQQTIQTRVSFTAMSSVNIRAGLVEHVSDVNIRVLLADSTVDVGNTHAHDFRRGQLVYLVEHLNILAGDNTLHNVVVPYTLPFSPEALCLQTVNADLLDDAGNLLYRLSADPLPRGGCYGARMAA